MVSQESNLPSRQARHTVDLVVTSIHPAAASQVCPTMPHDDKLREAHGGIEGHGECLG